MKIDDKMPSHGLTPLTDMWNAEELVKHHGENMRWCKKFGGWHCWENGVWIPEEHEQIESWAKETVRRMIFHENIKIAKHAKRCESASKLRAMVELAKSEPGITLLPDDFDRDGFLLNCQNGIVDLASGKLLPHDKTKYMTKMVNAPYDPDAICPIWDWFLDDIFLGNEDTIRFMQRAIGYSLTASIKEQCFFILYGKGSNGKGTMLNTILALLGEYADSPTAETFFIKKNDSGNSNDVAALKGKRYIVASESNKERAINEAFIRRLTGEDPIRARFLFQEFFTFDATFKIFLMTNHKPKLSDDYATWRRVKLVPFNKTVTEIDNNLTHKLRAELPGILHWAVEGCLAWQREGLGSAKEVDDATKEYRQEEDIVGNFITEHCVMDPNQSVSSSLLYAKYLSCVKASSEHHMTQKEFVRCLQNRDFTKDQRTYGPDKGKMYWHGIGLKNADENDNISGGNSRADFE